MSIDAANNFPSEQPTNPAWDPEHDGIDPDLKADIPDDQRDNSHIVTERIKRVTSAGEHDSTPPKESPLAAYRRRGREKWSKKGRRETGKTMLWVGLGSFGLTAAVAGAGILAANQASDTPDRNNPVPPRSPQNNTAPLIPGEAAPGENPDTVVAPPLTIERSDVSKRDIELGPATQERYQPIAEHVALDLPTDQELGLGDIEGYLDDLNINAPVVPTANVHEYSEWQWGENDYMYDEDGNRQGLSFLAWKERQYTLQQNGSIDYTLTAYTNALWVNPDLTDSEAGVLNELASDKIGRVSFEDNETLQAINQNIEEINQILDVTDLPTDNIMLVSELRAYDPEIDSWAVDTSVINARSGEWLEISARNEASGPLSFAKLSESQPGHTEVNLQ